MLPIFITIAILSAFLSSLVALGADRYPILLRQFAFALLTISGLSAICGGIEALLTNNVVTTHFPLGLPWMMWHLRIDALSGLFFIIVGIVTTAISFYGPGYIREFEHGHYPLSVLGFFTGLFIAGMLLVLLANDAFSFMIAWELMSLSSYFLVAYQHLQSANRRAAFLYLLMAHVGALAILLAFAVLGTASGDYTFDAMRQTHFSLQWASVAFALGLLGFGMKAGLVPVHAWLPEAHPVAPSHISALMSGVMLKIAIYGLIRLTFDLLAPAQHWSWGVTLLILGSESALLGILYALLQTDLKRLLAYSSIENVGIICVGLGLSLLFMAGGNPRVGTLGLLAALYHALNHAIFKGLLFLGAGAILYSSHERDLERMGGLIKRIPYSAVFFLIGCLSISALPPFNGFVSEWLIFQTALQAPTLQSGILRTLIPVSAALLALTSALSASCFVKVYGIAFLGLPRSRRVRRAHRVSGGMRIAQGLLAVLCLLLGIFPTIIISVLDNIPTQLMGFGLPSAFAEGWLWLTPISGQVASYSAALVLLSVLAAWLVAYVVLRLLGSQQTRQIYPWDCGFGPLNARMQYTATAFAMPIRRIFAPLWRVEESIEDIKDDKTLSSVKIHHQLHIVDRSWIAVYEPTNKIIGKLARQLTIIQTGHIRTYLAYSFFTLLILLWLIT